MRNIFFNAPSLLQSCRNRRFSRTGDASQIVIKVRKLMDPHFRKIGIAGAVLVVSIANSFSQDYGNTYQGSIHVSGTAINYYLPVLADIEVVPLPAIVVHTGTAGAYQVIGDTQTPGWGAAELLNVSGSIAANSSGTFQASAWRNGFGWNSSPGTNLQPPPAVTLRIRLLFFGVTQDTAYISCGVTGLYDALHQGFDTKPLLLGSTATWPTPHVYSGSIPAGGRAGLPDQLTVKCAILDEGSGPGARVQFLVGGKPYEMGQTQEGIPALLKAFTTAITETTQGGSLENIGVKLLLDGQQVSSVAATPVPFPNHMVTVDFGTLRIGAGGSCAVCKDGMCVSGKMVAGVRPSAVGP